MQLWTDLKRPEKGSILLRALAVFTEIQWHRKLSRLLGDSVDLCQEARSMIWVVTILHGSISVVVFSKLVGRSNYTLTHHKETEPVKLSATIDWKITRDLLNPWKIVVKCSFLKFLDRIWALVLPRIPSIGSKTVNHITGVVKCKFSPTFGNNLEQKWIKELVPSGFSLLKFSYYSGKSVILPSPLLALFAIDWLVRFCLSHFSSFLKDRRPGAIPPSLQKT